VGSGGAEYSRQSGGAIKGNREPEHHKSGVIPPVYWITTDNFHIHWQVPLRHNLELIVLVYIYFLFIQ